MINLYAGRYQTGVQIASLRALLASQLDQSQIQVVFSSQLAQFSPFAKAVLLCREVAAPHIEQPVVAALAALRVDAAHLCVLIL